MPGDDKGSITGGDKKGLLWKILYVVLAIAAIVLVAFIIYEFLVHMEWIGPAAGLTEGKVGHDTKLVGNGSDVDTGRKERVPMESAFNLINKPENIAN